MEKIEKFTEFINRWVNTALMKNVQRLVLDTVIGRRRREKPFFFPFKRHLQLFTINFPGQVPTSYLTGIIRSFYNNF